MVLSQWEGPRNASILITVCIFLTVSYHPAHWGRYSTVLWQREFTQRTQNTSLPSPQPNHPTVTGLIRGTVHAAADKFQSVPVRISAGQPLVYTNTIPDKMNTQIRPTLTFPRHNYNESRAGWVHKSMDMNFCCTAVSEAIFPKL